MSGARAQVAPLGRRNPGSSGASLVDLCGLQLDDVRCLLEVALECEGDRLRATVDPELQQDVLDVLLDRLWRDDEVTGDLGVVEPAREQAQDLELSARQAGDDRARYGARPTRQAVH